VNPGARSDCSELLLDLLWYEIHCRRLSPEMESILTGHLAECFACRMRFSEFVQALEEAPFASPAHERCPSDILS